MQFKHPEILYALLLLIIPIIVHLFQLQRFVKVPFTNVQFLKKIKEQSRKSSQLKKWLILICRTLALASLIVAFAQPYYATFKENYQYETTVYLDNSYSMQAKGEKGPLLQNSLQQIIESYGIFKGNFSFLTNNNSIELNEHESFKGQLKLINFTASPFNLKSALLKLSQQKQKKSNTLTTNILISDFQNINTSLKNDIQNLSTTTHLVNLKPKPANNIYIDSINVNQSKTPERTLEVFLRSNLKTSETVSVSIFNNNKLIGKSAAKFTNSLKTSIVFSLPKEWISRGKISIDEDGLLFDNTFFFSIPKKERINVLSLGKSADFLQRIYDNSEFYYQNLSDAKINFQSFKNQQIIILNEIKEISLGLEAALATFKENGGVLVIIPSIDSDMYSYKRFFDTLNLGTIFKSSTTSELLITDINYNHPLFTNVFEEKVTNFQYPKAKAFFKVSSKKQLPIVSYNNTEPFVSSLKNTVYLFSSPLNENVTNFTHSPLIVPLFYKMATNSINLGKLYYTIAPNTMVDLKINLTNNDVLTISNDEATFIPLQQISKNKVSLTLQNQVEKSGFYVIKNKEKELKTLAFNYNRNESKLHYANINELTKSNKNIAVYNSLNQVFDKIYNQQKINWLFKWFLIVTVLFLLFEMLILKYFKI